MDAGGFWRCKLAAVILDSRSLGFRQALGLEVYTSHMRQKDGPCGPDARLFEEAPAVIADQRSQLIDEQPWPPAAEIESWRVE
jgi:hypothetical protein